MSPTHGKGVRADHLVCWWGWGCSQSSNLLFALLCYWDQHIPSLESDHWSRRWWIGCDWPMEECVVAGFCPVGSSSWSLWSLYLERRPWWQGTHCLPLISRPPPQGWCFGQGWLFLPSVDLLSCRKSSYPLRVKRRASVRLVSWMQMMSTPSLSRNSCGSGFFFRSPSAFHCARASRTACFRMTREAVCFLPSLLFLIRHTSCSGWAPLRLGARHCHRLVFHGTRNIPPYGSLHVYVG